LVVGYTKNIKTDDFFDFLMRTISKEEFEKERDIIKTSLNENNVVFIYPTDTIYGLGCNALKKESVENIRRIKQRDNSPFSVIAPSKEWIDENCVINQNAKEWIKRLPGPYTLILKVKKQCVAENVAPDLGTLGVRIPDHWFSDFVKETNIPIITTSVNKSKSDFMTSLDDLDNEIKSKVDFIIYEGEIKGKPSKIIDLTDETRVVER